ncbi:MAG: bifunctional riboflavin kinase/FAD synthetase [Bacteroidota bacterium]
MKIFSDTASLPSFDKAVVTIGTFDGVHLGHRQIIQQLKNEAQQIGGETVLVTFDPHPRKIVSSKPLLLLNTLAEKTELLEKQGINNLVVVPFTQAFSEQVASAYVEDFLVSRFHPHTVIIGYDHRFGKDREGDFHLLEEYARQHAFKLIEIPVHLVEQAAISSTKIREALLQGRVSDARRFLGYDYFFEGTVIEGNKLGRTIGYPTANLQPQAADKLVPGNGVYAVYAGIRASPGVAQSSGLHKGMMNIGFRPTVEGTKKVIEVNLFDFDVDIYGKTLRVYLKEYLRVEQKFSGLEELKGQLAQDRATALALL